MRRCLMLLLLGLLCSCRGPAESAAPVRAQKSSIRVTSPAFRDGGSIPVQYSCDGQKLSPPLAWSGTPAGAKSLALLVEDPDAPSGIFTHWVLYNLPPAVRELPAGVPARETLPDGGIQGKNDFGGIGYGAPCPPGGVHRYIFTVYALNTRLRLPSGAVRAQLLAAIQGHVLAQGSLMGRYRRGGR